MFTFGEKHSVPRITGSNPISKGGFSGLNGRKAASSHQGWKFAGSLEKSPHGQSGHSWATGPLETVSDDAAGTLEEPGAGATASGLATPSAPEVLCQLSPVARMTTHNTCAVELLMLRGNDVLARTVVVSVQEGILMVRTMCLAVNRYGNSESVPQIRPFTVKLLAATDTLPTFERNNTEVFGTFGLSPLSVTGGTLEVID